MRVWTKAIGLAVLGLTLFAGTSQAAIITDFQIEATVTGCFGTGCSPVAFQFDDPFTWDDQAFDVATVAGAGQDTLGTFSRTTGAMGAGNFTGTRPFTLQVSFTVPAGVTPNPDTFAATFTGQAMGGGGAVFINFTDNSFRNFTFTDGSFQFRVLDIGTAPGVDGLDKGETLPLIGEIQNAQMRVEDVAVVPEPASLTLFGLGLAGTAAAVRRHRSRRKTS